MRYTTRKGRTPGPGDVVEIDPDHRAQFRKARGALSRRVAGVVSTAPAITLGNDYDAADERWQDDRPLRFGGPGTGQGYRRARGNRGGRSAGQLTDPGLCHEAVLMARSKSSQSPFFSNV